MNFIWIPSVNENHHVFLSHFIMYVVMHGRLSARYACHSSVSLFPPVPYEPVDVGNKNRVYTTLSHHHQVSHTWRKNWVETLPNEMYNLRYLNIYGDYVYG